MLKQKYNWVILIIIAFFISFVLVIGLRVNQTAASAQPGWEETNVSGWSWAGIATSTGGPDNIPHIGWFSNNCYNSFYGVLEKQCNADYGLKIDPETGYITGYSWNAILDDSGAVTGIGWLDFDPDPFSSIANYSAHVEPVGSTYEGQMSGWIIVNSMDAAGRKIGQGGWGWILLGPDPGPSRPWGADIDFTTGQLSGYAWSGGYLDDDTLPPICESGACDENVTTGLGWIDFSQATYSSGALHGWAWVGNNESTGSFDTNIGWIALNCENAGAGGGNVCGSTNNFKVTVNANTGLVYGYGWAGNSEIMDVGAPLGWVDFGPVVYPDWPNFPARFFKNNPDAYNDPVTGDPLYDYDAGDVAGWARLTVLQTAGEETGLENWGWVKLHPTLDETGCSGQPCDYGVTIDFNTGKLNGYAWSSGGTVDVNTYDPSVGLGWISFENTIDDLPSTYVAPFLETQQGDIFSTLGVGTDVTQNPLEDEETTFNPPPKSLEPGSDLYYNATYLIQSGGEIYHFTSESAETEPEYLQPGYDSQLEPPFATNRYTNVMGKLDLGQYGLTYYENPLDHLNKFGNYVQDYSIGNKLSSEIWSSGDVQLNNKVYYIQGDLTIDNNLTIKNGDVTENPIASGTIVVEGDLNINKGINYDPDALPQPPAERKLEYVPSVAWIVKGSVTVDVSVENADGNFIVVGKDSDAPIGELDSGTGNFSTGGGTKTLNISGLVIANEIFLQRSGIGTLENIQPAEKVFFDGRISVNTPPGLNDFAAALPVIREVAPIEISP